MITPTDDVAKLKEKAESFDKIEAIVKKCVLHKMSAKEAINAIFAEIGALSSRAGNENVKPK